MRKYRTKVSIFGTLLITLLFYASMTVSATVEPENYGETEVDASSNLAATITPWPFGNLEIAPPDTVKIWFRVSWSDDRGAIPPPPTATHYFNITGDYDGGAQFEYNEHTEPTYGATTGGTDIYVIFTNVYDDKYIDVTLLARVTLPGKSPVQDYDEHSILLVDNIP
jgi:hypothetical protein